MFKRSEKRSPRRFGPQKKHYQPSTVCFFRFPKRARSRRPVSPDCVRHHAVPANRRGFPVDRNPRNSGRLPSRVAVCELNSGRSPAFCAQNRPPVSARKIPFPGPRDGEVGAELSVRQIEGGGTICSGWIASIRWAQPAGIGSCSPMARHCSNQSIGRSVRRLTLNPRGRRPSIAQLVH